MTYELQSAAGLPTIRTGVQLSMKKLKIDKIFFFQVFNADWNFEPHEEEVYLCKETGQLLFFPDERADYYESGSEEKHEAVAKNPDRYLRIPKTTHDEHHEILKDFLSSIKNSDSFHKSEITYANAAYTIAESIGFWKKQVSEEMYDAYQDFREKVLETEGEEWLRKNGIEVEWS